jgi:hypothetical protein
MNQLRIIEYRAMDDYHVCLDENGGKHRVDLRISSDLPRDVSNESLVGLTISYENMHPYIEIAQGISIVKGSK